MRDLATAAPSTFAGVRFVLTDMDETLTYRGRLSARTYDAIERLDDAGVRVIPVTAAPAGWCDQMARMWPVSGVIGENGGLFLQRSGEHRVDRLFWRRDTDHQNLSNRLEEIGRHVQSLVPAARLADDQPFRLTSIAFSLPDTPEDRTAILAALRSAGADATVNNLWILGWVGGYDKLTMTRRVMIDIYGLDIDAEPSAILYLGDSTNDAPMFEFFKHTVGVSTVRRHLSEIPAPPKWITRGPGGEGFIEVANAVLKANGHA
jgi:HAD superfamily hydrolase (TIGR01484 family)